MVKASCARPACGGSRRTGRGFGLVEVLVSTALATILLGTLIGVTLGGLQSQAASRERNELIYQARSGLALIVARAQTTPPKPLGAAPARSTGDWFSPAMYCLKTASRQLIETTPADSACSGSRVIADHITDFSAQPLPSTSLVASSAVRLVLTVATPAGSQALPPFAVIARLGGGTL